MEVSLSRQSKRSQGRAEMQQHGSEGYAELKRMSDAVREAYAAISAMERPYKICYLIPHGDQDLGQASPLGWYTPGLHEAAGPMKLASSLPADIREPYSQTDSVLLNRLLRRIWPFITPIELTLVPHIALTIEMPFQVYLTNNAVVADDLDRILAGMKLPVLHASSEPGANRISFEALTSERVSLYVRQAMEALAADPQWESFLRQARRVMSESPQRKFKKHSLALGLHNVVAPNELALMAFGWKFKSVKRISEPGFRIATRPQVYVDRICASADAVAAERERLLKGYPPGLIDYRLVLAVASMYWGHFENWREMVQRAKPSMRKGLKNALSAAVQGQTYFDSPEIDANGRPIGGEAYIALAQERAADMASFTAALSFISTASLAPVLRLEPRLNAVREDLKVLAHCVRAEASRNFDWKTSRLTGALGRKMRALINPSFLTRIDAPEQNNRIEGMKLVCDLPLELLPTRGLPLGLRYDVSRVSPVPGNLFLQECTMPPAMLPVRAFDDVLVVRSFKSTDPLRRMLETAVGAIQESGDIEHVRYRFVDVETVDQFVRALNEFQGAILVFDGHGTVDKETGVGSLVIGDEILDAWTIRKECRMPPIVMFSACDTQPIDGSHGSVATAAFVLGARAVLATMFPIYGARAAVFNARMLLRIDQFIPIAVKYRPVMTWREVVSGMLRMSHSVEVLRQVNRRARLGLTREQMDRIQLGANESINARHADWYEVFLAHIAELSGRSVARVTEDVGRWAGLTDSMKYIQLGNPESIVIVQELPQETFTNYVRSVVHGPHQQPDPFPLRAH